MFRFIFYNWFLLNPLQNGKASFGSSTILPAEIEATLGAEAVDGPPEVDNTAPLLKQKVHPYQSLIRVQVVHSFRFR